MKFQPGDPKPANSGRKPGTKNKKTLLRVGEYCVAKSINPVEEIIKELPNLQPAQRVHVWFELLKYVAPQLKPVEVPLDLPDPTPESEVLDAETTEKLIELAKQQ